jgi:hypothetical protein
MYPDKEKPSPASIRASNRLARGGRDRILPATRGDEAALETQTSSEFRLPFLAKALHDATLIVLQTWISPNNDDEQEKRILGRVVSSPLPVSRPSPRTILHPFTSSTGRGKILS